MTLRQRPGHPSQIGTREVRFQNAAIGRVNHKLKLLDDRNTLAKITAVKRSNSLDKMASLFPLNAQHRLLPRPQVAGPRLHLRRGRPGQTGAFLANPYPHAGRLLVFAASNNHVHSSRQPHRAPQRVALWFKRTSPRQTARRQSQRGLTKRMRFEQRFADHAPKIQNKNVCGRHANMPPSC